jgi:hypothetical protein
MDPRMQPAMISLSVIQLRATGKVASGGLMREVTKGLEGVGGNFFGGALYIVPSAGWFITNWALGYDIGFTGMKHFGVSGAVGFLEKEAHQTLSRFLASLHANSGRNEGCFFSSFRPRAGDSV